MPKKTPEEKAREKEERGILRRTQAKKAFWDFSREVSQISLGNPHNPQEAIIPRPISTKLARLSREANIAMEHEAKIARQNQDTSGSGGGEQQG